MERLPATQKDLLKVKGIGKQKLDEFGSGLLVLIREYKKNVKKLTAAAQRVVRVRRPLPRLLPLLPSLMHLLQ